MRNKKVSIIFILMVMLVLSSCGYRFTPTGGIVPEGAQSIAVPVFLNGTNEPYVDVELTRAVVEEFLTDGRLKVVNLEEADLVVFGKIKKFELVPVAYDANSYVQTYNMHSVVSFTLEDARTRKILLQEPGIAVLFLSSYTVTAGDITATKIAKDAAMKKACKDFSLTIRSRVLDGF